MKVGVNFFVTSRTVDAITLARAIEEAGFDSFWVPDHTVLPAGDIEYHRGDRKPPRVYGEMADPFVLLAYAAAVTKTIKLATGVLVAAQRHPLTLAKTVSTLDSFSKGRVILGVGGGWLAQEIELFGVSYADRWAFVEESVAAMRQLWRHGRGSFDGQFVRFPEVICDPMPVSRPHPPVVIGGPATPGLLRRVARFGDGWAPVFARPDDIRQARDQLDRECAALGRDPSEIEISPFVMDVSPEAQEAYAAAGADRLVLQLYNNPGRPLAFSEWEAQHVRAGSASPPAPSETLGALEAHARLASL